MSSSGIVKWFNDAKGFGFINCDGKDFFVHYAEIVGDGYKSLKEGEKVIFQAETSPRGPIARVVVKEQ